MLLLTPKTPITNWVFSHSHSQHSFNHTKTTFVFFKKTSINVNTASYIKTQIPDPLSRTLNQSITEYNIEIRKFCDVGNLEKAMNLVSESKRSNLEVATYCSLLQLCAELKSIQKGRKIHSIIESNGVEIDSVLGSKLVFMYVSCGDLREGRRVFDSIANEKVFLWNMFINEYAKNGNYDEGIGLYRKMQCFGVGPNSHTLTYILKCFGGEGIVTEGERVHGYLLKLGFSNVDIEVVNALIAFYFKCGCTESASKVFGEMGERDVITWNSMISGYVANKLAEKGVRIFVQMLYLRIIVDFVTMLNVITACVSIGIVLLGRAVHAYAIKSGLGKDASFRNTLVDMYSKCGDIDSATRVFKTMDEKCVVSWTSMISGFVRHGLSDKAMLLFDDMKKEGIKLDPFIVTSVLHACACVGSLEKGKEVHNYIKENNMHLNLSVSNALMDMYAKCGSMEEAHLIFSQMTIKDKLSFNTMIGGYSKNNFPNRALHLFNEMQRQMKPDSVTMACVLSACVSLRALDEGREIHSYVLRNGIWGDIFVDNALIDMYAKCGALDVARSLFDIIPRKDLVSWTIMISGYAMNGEGNKAISTFNEMTKSGTEPDECFFLSTFCACNHSRLADVGWRFFNIMRSVCNIEPTYEHYTRMVELFSKSGKLSMGYEFIEKMPMKPDATIWGVLLCGCKIHHDVNLAEKVADRVFEIEPNNMGYYLTLADIYAEDEKREKARKTSQKISRRSLKKNPS